MSNRVLLGTPYGRVAGAEDEGPLLQKGRILEQAQPLVVVLRSRMEFTSTSRQQELLLTIGISKPQLGLLRNCKDSHRK